MNAGPVKPAEGLPCNGCGVCCHLEPCYVAERFVGRKLAPPCPFMWKEAGRYQCAIVLEEKRLGLGDKIAAALGCGKGCDSDSPAGEVVP